MCPRSPCVSPVDPHIYLGYSHSCCFTMLFEIYMSPQSWLKIDKYIQITTNYETPLSKINYPPRNPACLDSSQTGSGQTGSSQKSRNFQQPTFMDKCDDVWQHIRNVWQNVRIKTTYGRGMVFVAFL